MDKDPLPRDRIYAYCWQKGFKNKCCLATIIFRRRRVMTAFTFISEPVTYKRLQFLIYRVLYKKGHKTFFGLIQNQYKHTELHVLVHYYCRNHKKEKNTNYLKLSHSKTVILHFSTYCVLRYRSFFVVYQNCSFRTIFWNR